MSQETSANLCRPTSCRWETRFARAVRQYGVARLADDLQVDPTAIYQWIRGSVSPRPDKALVIVKLLARRLRLEEIYQHRLTVQAHARQESDRLRATWEQQGISPLS